MKEAMENSHDEKCPCWSIDGNRECAITEGGVYIPLLKHRMMFCQSSNYIHCAQYIKGRELIVGKDVGERRRMRRYAKNIYMDIAVCDSTNNFSVTGKYKVRTLDMSLYGMKIESAEKFTTDTVIGFELDPDLSSDFLSGTGTVKWCEQQINSDRFEFGVDFSNDTAIQKRIENLLYM